MATDRLIRWLPEYAVGVQEIDQEHQGLFALAEKLKRAMATGQPAEVLQPILDELVAHVCAHFVHEEELMQRISYPHYQGHQREHEELRAQMQAMSCSTANDVMQHLMDWLKCHTTTSDRRIGIYMSTHGLVT